MKCPRGCVPAGQLGAPSEPEPVYRPGESVRYIGTFDPRLKRAEGTVRERMPGRKPVYKVRWDFPDGSTVISLHHGTIELRKSGLGAAPAPLGEAPGAPDPRAAIFERFKDAVRHVWKNADFVLPVVGLSPEEPSGAVLASVTFNPRGVWASGSSLLRRAPQYTLRVSNRLLALPPEQQWAVLVHEAVHFGYPRHDRGFRDLCREKGGTQSEEGLDGQGIKAEKKVGSRYQTMRTFTDEKEATRWAKEQQQRAEPGSRWRLSLGGAPDQTAEVWYHITDNPQFGLNPEYAPEDNSIAIYSRDGQKGVYLTQDVEKWVNGHNYVRPFVAEFRTDPTVKSLPGVHGRYGGELFVPAAHYDKLQLVRVIPLDALAREEFGDHGWIESHHGSKFDTGEPVLRPGKTGWRPGLLTNYRYAGPDVRQMPQAQVDQHLTRWRSHMKENRNIDVG